VRADICPPFLVLCQVDGEYRKGQTAEKREETGEKIGDSRREQTVDNRQQIEERGEERRERRE
jgi:hypothetical protein